MNKSTQHLITIRLLNTMYGIESGRIGNHLMYIENMRNKSGLTYTIRYMKTARLHITRYMCGKPLMTNQARVSLTSGFPTQFLGMKEIIDSKNLVKIRGILSLLNYTRSIKPTSKELSKVKPDFTTITNKYSGKDYTIPKGFIGDFVKKFNLKSANPKWTKSDHFLNDKKSPFGKSTLTASYGLFYCIEHAQNHIEKLAQFIGDAMFPKILGDFIKELGNDHRLMKIGNPMNGLGKLSIVNDPELKLRIIAQVDYYSQFILKPIHEILLKKLRNFPSDRTFTQDPHNDGTKNSSKFGSLDLSAATDRFPVKLQTKLLSFIFDESLATKGEDLLVNRMFSYKASKFNYTVGQPMGAYSSWAAFSVTHHLVVQGAAYLSKIDNFKDYILLGDDIVIRNDIVARRYIKVMTKLGVDISFQKTHVSKNTYEFAKRWIKNKKEVSGIPLRGILSNLGNPYVVLQQLMVYRLRVLDLGKGDTLSLVCTIYNKIKVGKKYYTSNKTYNLLYKFNLILRYSLNVCTNEELRKFFIDVNKSEIPIPNSDIISSFMRNILIQGINLTVEKNSRQVFAYYNKFLSNYELFDNFSNDKLKDHPLTNALYNKMKSMKSFLMKVKNDEDIDLLDCLNHMRIMDVDKVVSIHRDTGKTVIAMDKLGKDSLKRLTLINEDNYLNFPISQFGEISTPNPMSNYFIDSLSNSLDKMESLKSGPSLMMG